MHLRTIGQPTTASACRFAPPPRGHGASCRALPGRSLVARGAAGGAGQGAVPRAAAALGGRGVGAAPARGARDHPAARAGRRPCWRRRRPLPPHPRRRSQRRGTPRAPPCAPVMRRAAPRAAASAPHDGTRLTRRACARAGGPEAGGWDPLHPPARRDVRGGGSAVRQAALGDGQLDPIRAGM